MEEGNVANSPVWARLGSFGSIHDSIPFSRRLGRRLRSTKMPRLGRVVEELSLDGEAAGGADRSFRVLGVESEDQGVVVVEFHLGDPGVRIGVVAFPTDEVLVGAAVFAGFEDCVDEVPFVDCVIVDDRSRRGRGSSAGKIVGVVWFEKGGVEGRVNLHGVGKVEAEGGLADDL